MAVPNTPLWLNPSSQGQLSNKRASNTTSDLVTAQVRFDSDVASAKPGSVRVVGQRLQVAGVPMPKSNDIWDTAWVGNFATSSFPLSGLMLGPNSAVTVMNRIYVVAPGPGPFGALSNVIGVVVSAPVNGPNVGSWRYESPIIVQTQAGFDQLSPVIDSCDPGALAYCNGRLYALGKKGIYYSTIGPDGQLGTWQFGIATTSGTGDTMVAWQRITGTNLPGGGLVVSYGSFGTTTTTVNAFLVNPDGTIGPAISWSALGVNRKWCGLMIDANSWCYLIAGEDNAGTPVNTTYYASVNLVDGSFVGVGWFTSTATGLPNRSRFGFTYVYSPTQFWPNSGLTESAAHVMGGTATNGGAGTTTVYTIPGASIRGGGAWAAFTNAMPTAVKGNAAALSGSEDTPVQVTPGAPLPGYNFAPWSALGFESAIASTGFAYVASIAGTTSTDVQVTTLAPAFSGGGGPWYKGAQSALASATLGNGGLVTANADGTYDLTFPIGGKNVSGFGQTMGVTTLPDGDILQLIVQIADALSGDIATSLPTTIRIGQPPSLASITPSGTITNGQPTLSFQYVNGAGGANQFSYQMQFKQGSTVLYDTGVRYDSINSALLTIAPLLTPSTTYTNGLIITATSLDTPMPGASNTITSTTTITTSAFALPGVPGSFTATPSGPNANVAFSWSAGSSATGYNLYYRRNGSSTWLLYVKPGNVTSYTGTDHLALGVAYDFAVSSTSAVPGESALSSAQTNVTIPTGAYSAWLHLAGAGGGVALQIQGSPTVARKMAAGYLLGHGQAAPVERFGPSSYITLAGTGLLLDATSATLKQVQAILDGVAAGGAVFYRDALGGQLLMGTDADQGVVIKPPFYREVQLKLTEVADLIGPYVASGSAQGYQALVSGRKPPLDTSERLI